MRTITARHMGWMGLFGLLSIGWINKNTIQSLSWNFSQWLISEQRLLYRALGEQMQTLPETLGGTQILTIMGLCFVYGVFHAAGPGHGKVVISAYLLSQPSRLRTGIQLSIAAALVQGLTAITMVTVFIITIGWAARDVLQHAQSFDLASFLAIALLGAIIMVRAGRLLWQHLRHSFKTKLSVQQLTPVVPLPQSSDHKQHCTLCGHSHHVTPEQWLGRTHWQRLGLVAAVGIRPCTGALLILMMAHLLGIWWVGLLGVLAMSMGTAITVALLAILSVQARSWATRWLAVQPRTLPAFTASLAMMGGLILTVIGVSLGVGAWFSPPQSIWF